MNNFVYVNLVGVTLGFLLGTALLIESRRLGKTALYLGLLALTEGLMLMRGFLSNGGFMLTNPHLLGILIPLTYLRGPLIFLLVSNEMNSQPGRLWLHVLPLVASFLLLLPLFGLSGDQKIVLYQAYHGTDTVSTIFSQFSISVAINVFQPITIGIAILIYALWSLVRLANAGLLRTLFITSLLATLMFTEGMLRVAGIGFAFVAGNPPVGLAIKIAALLIVAAVYFKAIILLKQGLGSRRSSGESILESIVRIEPDVKYARSGMDERQRTELLQRFDKLMTIEEAFLDSDLTLVDLASQLDTTSNRVSQALNEGRGLTFRAVLGRYRVERAQVILADPSNAEKPIVDIAIESGYNDRSTFYRQFKSEYGIAPATYRTTCLAKDVNFVTRGRSITKISD